MWPRLSIAQVFVGQFRLLHVGLVQVDSRTAQRLLKVLQTALSHGFEYLHTGTLLIVVLWESRITRIGFNKIPGGFGIGVEDYVRKSSYSPSDSFFLPFRHVCILHAAFLQGSLGFVGINVASGSRKCGAGQCLQIGFDLNSPVR